MENLDTIELCIKLTPKEPWSDVLIAELSERGFDSFVVTEKGINAYAPRALDWREAIKETSFGKCEGLFEFEIKHTIIPHQNWNENWETNFHPVHVEDYATIIAPFHREVEMKGVLIEIQPQMSFGTGHHQTTWMMTKALFELDQKLGRVLDMGTGTGVLAIVAEKLGAQDILAIDIEEWSVENARENAKRNHCEAITCLHGDVQSIKGRKFEIIVANINKNVLIADMDVYCDSLLKGGKVLLSGFFESDVSTLVAFCQNFGLVLEKQLCRESWACIQLRKE